MVSRWLAVITAVVWAAFTLRMFVAGDTTPAAAPRAE